MTVPKDSFNTDEASRYKIINKTRRITKRRRNSNIRRASFKTVHGENFIQTKMKNREDK